MEKVDRHEFPSSIEQVLKLKVAFGCRCIMLDCPLQNLAELRV